MIPSSPAEAVFELFEAIVSYLSGVGLYNVPVYFINPVADTLLAYTNIIAEWYVLGMRREVRRESRCGV